MARIPGIRRLFRFPSSEERVKDDVATEIAFHVEERTQELTTRGMDAAAARAAALREFGDVREARKELEAIDRRRVRQMHRADWWSDLRLDLRYGARSLLHAPLFSLLAVGTLALGIGANAAVFGVLKSVLLDALPYADADRLVRVYGRMLDSTQERGPLSAGTVKAIADRQQSFEGLAAFAGFPADAVYGGDDGPRMVKTVSVEPAFFQTLGVPAALGRTFRDDDRTSGLVALSGGQLAPDTRPRCRADARGLAAAVRGRSRCARAGCPHQRDSANRDRRAAARLRRTHGRRPTSTLRSTSARSSPTRSRCGARSGSAWSRA